MKKLMSVAIAALSLAAWSEDTEPEQLAKVNEVRKSFYEERRVQREKGQDRRRRSEEAPKSEVAPKAEENSADAK